MNYWKFLLYTTIGAGAWHTILAAMGWYLQSIVPQGKLDETIERYNTYIIGGIIAIVAIVIAVFVIKHKRHRKHTDADNEC